MDEFNIFVNALLIFYEPGVKFSTGNNIILRC